MHTFRLGIAIALWFMPSVAHGQNCGFAPAQEYATGAGPQGVVIGDFNGDGRPDLAVTNANSNSVSILLANVTGGFAPAVSIPVATGPIDLVATDLNHDGALDLATANSNATSVSVVLGNGNGGFAAPSSFVVGTKPIDIDGGDFDMDGDADLAVLHTGAAAFLSDLAILLGDGAGGFEALMQTPAGNSGASLAIADLDADTVLDAAVVNNAGAFNPGSISILRGDGSGGFSSGTTVMAGTGVASVAIGELTGDGLLDLAVVGAPTVSVFAGDGQGNFASPPHAVYSLSWLPRFVALADLDVDGATDMVVGDFAYTKVSALHADGAGGFEPPIDYAVADAPRTLALGDLNADGVPDLVAASFGADVVSVFISQCSPGFSSSYGAGCVGWGAKIPVLAASCCLSPGLWTNLSITKGAGQATALIFTGVGQANTPIPGPGSCSLLLAQLFPVVLSVPLIGTGVGNGHVTIPLQIPLGLPPAVVNLQAFVIDSHVGQGYSNTNGVELHIQ